MKKHLRIFILSLFTILISCNQEEAPISSVSETLPAQPTVLTKQDSLRAVYSKYYAHPDTTHGYIDKNGLKQGLHVGSSGMFLYDRTYVNDSLNGYFRQYSDQSSTWEVGHYKNHNRDSIWIAYYGDGGINTVKRYKNGLNHGQFYTFYENGNLKYTANFQNDTMIGNAINYFENGAVKSQGNRENGIWKTWHENGQLASWEPFKDGSHYGELERYSAKGDTLLPAFVPASPADENVTNETDLIVDLIYTNKTGLKRLEFIDCFFYRLEIGTWKNQPIITCGSAVILIHENGAELHQNDTLKPESNIRTTAYGRTGNFQQGEVEKITHKTSLGKLIVNRQSDQCDDTGSNPITLIHQHKKLQINTIGNLEFFEFDVDQNGENELYFIAYATCQQKITIYRVFRAEKT